MITINSNNKAVFITGSAGFIGSNLVLELLKTQSPITIIGIDNVNDYYDVSIKEWRLSEIQKCAEKHPDSTWTFIKGNIADKSLIDSIFHDYNPDIVVNLAAQAGVRYSITNPDVYIESNLIGFYNILEACRHSYDNGAKGVEHLVCFRNLTGLFSQSPDMIIKCADRDPVFYTPLAVGKPAGSALSDQI